MTGRRWLWQGARGRRRAERPRRRPGVCARRAGAL